MPCADTCPIVLTKVAFIKIEHVVVYGLWLLWLAQVSSREPNQLINIAFLVCKAADQLILLEKTITSVQSL